MPDIDKIADKVEGLIEKIRGLKYKFNDEISESDANDSKEEAIAGLENWLEIVTKDFENNNDSEEEEIEDSD